MSTIAVEHVARIEGHGTISVSVKDGKLLHARLDVTEPARFFESMVRGRTYAEVPLIASRICGICSPNHTITAIKALEAAMSVDTTPRTALLRKVLVYGSYLQNHATHLYLFAAPDYVGAGSAFALAETHPHVLERALRLKKLGNELTTLVGGRSVHPITAVIGGFTREPPQTELAAILESLRAALPDALETVELFAAVNEPEFETEGDLLALVQDEDYAIYEGDVGSIRGGWRRPVSEYRDFLAESVVDHGNAKHSTVDGRAFAVGALARLSLSGKLLAPRAAQAAASAGVETGTVNPFRNNLCQAIELVDAIERCAGYIECFLEDDGESRPDAVRVRAGSGAAATEAPRGTLYHSYEVDGEGVVRSADIITPTAQNLGNLEADMGRFVAAVADLATDELSALVQRLVRAYDPCLSCSVH